MSTANVQIVCNDYTGFNTLKIGVFKQSDPTFEVGADFHAGPFTQAVFNFFNLDRVTHFRRLYEVDNNDHDIILATYPDKFFFIPADQKIEFKDSVEWQPGNDLMKDGITIFPDNVNGFIEPDWIGWDIDTLTVFTDEFPKVLWHNDPATGQLNWVNPTTTFATATWYKVTFKPKVKTAQPSGAGGLFKGKLYVTDDTTLSTGDLGKKVLLKGDKSNFIITLPPLSTTPELVVTFFEMPPSETARCVKIVVDGADTIDFGKGGKTSFFIKPSESLELYKEADDTDPLNIVLYWRIQNAQGNFLSVGEFVPEYAGGADVVNKIPTDGGEYDAAIEARLYEDYVTQLTGDAAAVAYSAWATDPTKFSLKDATSNKFHVPDTRGLYIRQSSSSLPTGSYMKNVIRDHKHAETGSELGGLPDNKTPELYNGVGTYDGTANNRARGLTGRQRVFNVPASGFLEQESSDETRPETVVANGYVRS